MDRLLKPVAWFVVGWVLAGLGLAFSILMVLQPWRSCPDDDSAAGCPVTPADANLTIAALMIMGAGVIMVLGTALRPRPHRPAPRPLSRRPDGRSVGAAPLPALASDPRNTAAELCGPGSPGVPARQYAEECPRRPLWSTGNVIAGLALFAYWTAFLLFAFGMLAAVDFNAPGQAHAMFLFVEVEAFSSPDAIGIGWSSSWQWLLVPCVITAVSFLLGSRFWRLRKTPAPGH